MEIAELVLEYVQALVWPLITLTLVYVLRAHLREAFARMTRVETPAGAIEFAVEARDVLNQAESVGDSAGQVPAWRGPQQAHGVPAPAGPPSGNGQNTDYLLPAPAGSGSGYPPPGHAPGGSGQGHPQPGQPVPGGPAYGYPQPGQPGSFGPVVVPSGPGAPQQRPGSVWRDGFRVARGVADSAPAAAVVTAWDVLERLCREVVPAHGPGRPPTDVASLGRALVACGLPAGSADVLTRLRGLRDRAPHLSYGVTPGAARDVIDACLTLAREVDALRGQ
ncbi:hypothetical protein [Streptomyces rubradiris]|uniref:DUF4145 domain-containing protein n=1 Tax=Streptomyces rubradiris TaxID=285531 RepID=A0ABQ3RBF3_STRRR|nr:hypothetical protein [Streptomyces rubradiris]GHH19684.1 hypothetical protein GCM10018792_52810 [Streptomyces rubradiris]GHI53147.1 hypothetical protein Srubr_29930 [Streptomyces rubradiris]